MDKQKITHSYLKKLLPENHFNYFVDIGAHNGVSISNSFPFIKKGWNCVSIEPNPYVYEDLEENLKKYEEHVILVKKAVSNVSGITKFHFDRRGFLKDRKKGGKADKKKGMRSTIQPELFKEMSDEFIMVEVDTITSILDSVDAPTEISIMSIDTEGMDYEVLEGLDSKYKIHIIITEDYSKTKDIKYKLLESKGYKHINQEGINSVWILN